MTPDAHLDQEWRLIIDSPARGAWNMAVDESILEAVGRYDVPPTLRLYAWDPPCLSLGYAQSMDDVDLNRLQASGWDLVRRPTGGKAILHTDELTYSIIGSYAVSLLKGSLLESYNAIAQGLLAALREMGITEANLELNHPPTTLQSNKLPDPICFVSLSRYEITVNKKKLLGSAQARKKEGILQHGTLPLYGDIARITQVLAYANEAERHAAAERMRTRAITVSEILDRQINWESAANALISGFEKVLGVDLGRSNLTESEKQRAEALLKSKYADQHWTHK